MRKLRKFVMILAMLPCLALAACPDEQKEAVVQTANAVVDQAQGSTSPWIALGGMLVAGVLTAVGLRRPVAAVAAAIRYPGTDFTDPELKEIHAGMVRLGLIPKA